MSTTRNSPSPPPAHGNRFRRRSIAKTVSAGLITLVGLLVVVTATAIYGFMSYRGVLSDLANQTLPRIVDHAEMSSRLNELLFLTERLSSAESAPLRRIAWSSIEEKFEEITLASRDISPDDQREDVLRKIGSLRDNLASLDHLVADRIVAHGRTEEASHQLAQALTNARSATARLAPLASADLLATLGTRLLDIEEMAQASQKASSLNDLRTLERAMEKAVDDLAAETTHPPFGDDRAFQKAQAGLRAALVGDLGILASYAAEIRASARSMGRGNFARSLVDEVNSSFNSQFHAMNEEMATVTRTVLEAVNTRVWIFGGVSGFAVLVAIAIHFYFRRILTNRLLALNASVLDRVAGRVAGREREIHDGGNDEITDIASSINYFANELGLAKEEAEASNRAKSQFLANVSHEVRTPLNTIMGTIFLALQTPLSEGQRAYIGRIESAAKHLLSIIDDILDISKAEAGKMELEAIAFDIEGVVRSVSEILGPQAAGKGLEFVVDTTALPTGTVTGDPLRLKQILINLVGNAVKFTERGEVRLTARALGPKDGRIRVRFEVTDTGIGIAEDQKKNLFSSFHQADTSITRRFGGSGLGLAISRNLVEMMEGRLSLDSTPGVGSRFTFELDLAFQPSERARILLSLPEGAAGRPVLVVDDVKSAREVLETQLNSLGLSVLQAASGPEALEILRAPAETGRRPFLVLMDWRMPGMDGMAALEAIARDPAITPKPAVVLVSAHGADLPVREGTQAPLPGLLAKPVTLDALAQGIAEALDPAPKGRRAKVTSDRDMEVARRMIAGMRVLVVEDQDINRDMVREILTSAGVEVLTARDGREALEVVERRQDAGGLDLILMDLQMPVMDGFAATQRIRETHPAQALPIMALSAHATTRETERCIAAGMNGHLSKPVDVALMFETLARFRGPGDIWWSAGTTATGETEDRDPGSPAPLLDTGDGIRRVLGNETLYRKMLAAFLRDQGDWMATLRALLAEHRDRDALDHLHALKGVTSNLSARRLLATLRSVEARFLEGAPPTAKTLDDLEATLGATLAAIAKGLEAMDGRPDEPPLTTGDAAPLDTAEREAFLAMLRGKELGARRFLTHHRARLRATWPTADWNALEVAMESLHFEDATRILEGTLP